MTYALTEQTKTKEAFYFNYQMTLN